MHRATLDTNIYISAFQFGGRPAALLDLAIDAELELFISQPIIEETVRILHTKFGWDSGELRFAEFIMRSCASLVKPSQILNVVLSDADDNRIVECAIASRSDIIISGDHHLLKLAKYEAIDILSVRDFLERLGET